MQSIKALVIIMGLLILAGLGLLVYGMVNQVSEVAGPGGPVAPDAPGGFDEVEISLPSGCSVVETRVDGDRLIVRTDGPDSNASCRKIIIIDLESGEVLGRVQFKLGP
jgi:hypothetical protein